jgi:hypothetical protein
LALSENEQILTDDIKHIVSMRLNNADRFAVRLIAERLSVRKSELYRFAVCHFIKQLHKLNDASCSGSDLLPVFLEFREELKTHLSLNKHQLFKIFNGKNTPSDKFVAMVDIELLLLPDHRVRQRLTQSSTVANQRDSTTGAWLENYLQKKYRFGMEFENSLDEDPSV